MEWRTRWYENMTRYRRFFEAQRKKGVLFADIPGETEWYMDEHDELLDALVEAYAYIDGLRHFGVVSEGVTQPNIEKMKNIIGSAKDLGSGSGAAPSEEPKP